MKPRDASTGARSQEEIDASNYVERVMSRVQVNDICKPNRCRNLALKTRRKRKNDNCSLFKLNPNLNQSRSSCLFFAIVLCSNFPVFSFGDKLLAIKKESLLPPIPSILISLPETFTLAIELSCNLFY